MSFQSGFDWYRMKFLESSVILKRLLSKAHGRNISSSLVNEIKASLQQGRSFFEIAKASPLEIKPLQLYYGMVGFGRALSMSKSLARQATLPSSHGLKDCSDPLSLLENHKLKFRKTGTFQGMNDNAKRLEYAFYHFENQPKKMEVQKCDSRDLEGKIIDLKEILARTEGMGKLFTDTFNEKQKVFPCSHFSKNSINPVFSFNIYYFPINKDRSTLIKNVKALREMFPFLENWRLDSATWGNLEPSFTFSASYLEDFDEFSEINLSEDSDGFVASYRKEGDDAHIKYSENIYPLSGSLHGNTCIIEPFEGLQLSELSLYYLGMFILSSLVRYRPNIWSNALSGRPGPTGIVDDKCLAVIEKFLTLSETRFPTMIEQAFERIQNMN